MFIVIYWKIILDLLLLQVNFSLFFLIILRGCAHALHLVVQDLVAVPCCVEVFEAAGLIATKFKIYN
jgi:hypothetical protein